MADDTDSDNAVAGGSDEDEEALHTTPIIEPINYIYGMTDNFIPLLNAFEIAFDLSIQRTLGAATCPDDSPSRWKEAMAGPDSDRWMDAAQTEIDTLLANGTWELVGLPEGQ